jgi:hypothetical protein
MPSNVPRYALHTMPPHLQSRGHMSPQVTEECSYHLQSRGAARGHKKTTQQSPYCQVDLCKLPIVITTHTKTSIIMDMRMYVCMYVCMPILVVFSIAVNPFCPKQPPLTVTSIPQQSIPYNLYIINQFFSVFSIFFQFPPLFSMF